ncbi:MAG: fimbrial protein [Bacteroides sp.]|nr:fimbrial protein [Bacteroides sp.]MCD8262747.1 fimbrial protein [Tannerellaceae bacterium]
MKTNKNILHTIGVAATLLQLSLAACTDSYGEWQPEPATSSPFTLALELPRPKTTQLTTRAMTDQEESEIQEITLLLFTAGTGNTELLESTHSIPGTALTRNSANNRLYTTTATLEPGTYSTFIVLANSAAILAQNPLLAKGTPPPQPDRRRTTPEPRRRHPVECHPAQFPALSYVGHHRRRKYRPCD